MVKNIFISNEYVFNKIIKVTLGVLFAFAFIVNIDVIVKAQSIDINDPIAVACDFACYSYPENAVGYITEEASIVMDDNTYIAVGVSNVKPLGYVLMVVLEKSSNDVVCAFHCQDYWDEMIYRNIYVAVPSLYSDYNNNKKGSCYYSDTTIGEAYRFLVSNLYVSDNSYYTLYDINGNGITDYVYYDTYDTTDPNAYYSYAYEYSNGKLRTVDVDYNNNIRPLIGKINWCKMNDATLVNTTYMNSISIIINGENLSFDQPPYIENGVTKVPMRKVFEALGAAVEYDEDTRKITAYKDDIVIELVIGSSTAKVNGKEIILTTDVEIKNGTTMVPLRFVSEALGSEVLWNGADKIININ